jgi:small redox-active disulfide protein 2
MKIEILGTGCAKCKKLYENAKAAARELGRDDIEIEKVEDIKQITARGVMMTPALCVDGQVKSTGKLLGPGDIKKLIG